MDFDKGRDSVGASAIYGAVETVVVAFVLALSGNTLRYSSRIKSSTIKAH